MNVMLEHASTPNAHTLVHITQPLKHMSETLYRHLACVMGAKKENKEHFS